jgi:hypothetical protein
MSLRVIFLLCIFISHTLTQVNSQDEKETQGDLIRGTMSFLRKSTNSSIASGVTFSREIAAIPNGSSFDLIFGANHCTSQDKYGDNNCHFDWGETLQGSYKLLLTEELDAGDTMSGHFKVGGRSQVMIILV